MAGRTAGRARRGRRACSTTGAALAAQGPELLERLGAQMVVGVDASGDSLDIARRTHVDPRLRFSTMIDLAPSGQFDVAYCNGVFHHVEPGERLDALAYIHRSLAEGGVLRFLGEQSLESRHSPGDATHPVRSRREADPRRRARELLTRAGFDVLETDFLFLFPRVLSALRPLEARLARLPAGAHTWFSLGRLDHEERC